MNSIIFGGTGFIGVHYARFLLNTLNSAKIILADIKDIESQFMFDDIKDAIEDGRLKYINCDVRNVADFDNLPEKDISLIANFAAIHREPGHEHDEYFKTNIPGAENVCRYAEKVGCNEIIFTSSIAVYEPTEFPKDETTIPAPISAYGGSKIVAEHIHRTWQEKSPSDRKLVIVRPGVVYGPAEGGNVTRMIKAIKKGFFAFIGNKETRKASIYVKELIGIIEHYRNLEGNYQLSNAVVPISPSMNEYVQAVKDTTKWKKIVPSVPYVVVLFLSIWVGLLSKIVGKETGISPVRVQKLRRINNITSKKLVDTNYKYQYTLQSAFEDWYKDNPADW